MIELQNEADATTLSPDPLECWQRSTYTMPRLRIVTEFKEFLIPWVHVAIIEADPSRKIIEIHTSLGLSFTISSREKQDTLYAFLQLERVKTIYPIEGVLIRVQMDVDGD